MPGRQARRASNLQQQMHADNVASTRPYPVAVMAVIPFPDSADSTDIPDAESLRPEPAGDAQDWLPYGRQHLDANDVAAVNTVLTSDFITQGPAVGAFEKAVATYCEVPHAVATNSATSALHIACLALGVGPGDLVWTTPNSFVASANCARYCGADVDFVDIDPDSLNLSVSALGARLAARQAAGEKLPSVVVPVHFGGQPCDMRELAALAGEYGFHVLEDASHAIGARYAGNPIGACEYSDITVFSFHPVKIVTSAEGGMATTRNEILAERLGRLRSHGIERSGDADEPWLYEQHDLGFNYRMTDIQAALGASQMRRIDQFITRRHELVARYTQKLAGLPLILPSVVDDGRRSAWHLYPVQLTMECGNGVERRRLYHALHAQRIGVNVHYIPIHTQPYYRDRGFREGDFPAAENYYARALSLPLFGTMTDAEQDRVVVALSRALEGRSAA